MFFHAKKDNISCKDELWRKRAGKKTVKRVGVCAWKICFEGWLLGNDRKQVAS